MQRKIENPGVADSLLHAAHIETAHHAHRVTVVAFNALLNKGDKDDLSEQATNWRISAMALLVSYYAICKCGKQLGEGNFTLYVESICSLIPSFLALYYHFGIDGCLHVRDILRKNRLAFAQKFDHDGQFVVHKTRKVFSLMAIAQAHELWC